MRYDEWSIHHGGLLTTFSSTQARISPDFYSSPFINPTIMNLLMDANQYSSIILLYRPSKVSNSGKVGVGVGNSCVILQSRYFSDFSLIQVCVLAAVDELHIFFKTIAFCCIFGHSIQMSLRNIINDLIFVCHTIIIIRIIKSVT